MIFNITEENRRAPATARGHVAGWDIKTLTEYVGWKNVQSALRYVEGADPFVRYQIESTLPLTADAVGAGAPKVRPPVKSDTPGRSAHRFAPSHQR